MRRIFFIFFFNDTATTEIYTLSLHDALPISSRATVCAISMGRLLFEGGGSAALNQARGTRAGGAEDAEVKKGPTRDRKSTRLNSSHLVISYAVFCLKKKNNTEFTALQTVQRT